MGKDTTAFRERFNAYKNGKSVSEIYDAGLPRYTEGKSSIIDTLDDDQLDTLHYINDYFSNLGMSTTDIAGIAANMFKESSFRHNAKDGAGYHGYVQMSPDMQLAVKAAYGNLDPDTQLQFVYDQLTGNSKVKGYTNGAGYQYGQYKTGGDAAEAFRSTFERNKAGRQQSRIDYGNQIYDYLANRAVENAIKKEIGEQPMPIIARPDATAVKKIVPKAKTRARWTGADTVSPYITGKPIIKLQKKTNLPNIIEENKKAQWKAPMGFSDGKTPYSVGNIIQSIYQNSPYEEFLGEPSHHYDFTQSEEWANSHGYYPDKRGHRDDRVKKLAHPSHPNRGKWNNDDFILTEKGMQDPNYAYFGLNDGGQDPQAILKYSGGIVLPEITVTPNGNYIYNSYDNIRLHFPKHK